MAIDTEISKLLADQMFAIYSTAETLMLEKVAKRIAKGITDIGWAESTLTDATGFRKEIEAITKDLTILGKDTVGKSIIEAYKTGKMSASKDMKAPESFMQNLFIPSSIQRLVLESNNMVVQTSTRILREATDAYRIVQAEAASLVLAGVETRKQASQRMLNKLADRGITSFVDKAGRKWDMATYAEMSMRTVTAHAALQGHLDRQAEIGNDLVIVSSFGASCPLCAPWGGDILSISGSGEYLSIQDARDAGLFHPNCRHTVTAYFPEIRERSLEGHKHNRDYEPVQYAMQQRQRANERQIRRWKRREVVALSPEEKFRAGNMVKHYQKAQRVLAVEYKDEWGIELKRKYDRESIKHRVGIKAEDHSLSWAEMKVVKTEAEKKARKAIEKKAIVLEATVKDRKTKMSSVIKSSEYTSKEAMWRALKEQYYVTKIDDLRDIAARKLGFESYKEAKEHLVLYKRSPSVWDDEIKYIEEIAKISLKADSNIIKQIVKPIIVKPDFEIEKIGTLKNLAKRQGQYKKDGDWNMSIEKEEKLKGILAEMVDNSEYRMRLPHDVLEKVLESKFKNQFEVGRSRGSYSPGNRRNASNKLFGTNMWEMEDSDYEIYGYLGDKDILRDSFGIGSDPSQYGHLIVTFKRNMIEQKTTFTIDDSLSIGINDRCVASRTVDIVPTNGRLSSLSVIRGTNWKDEFLNIGINPGNVCKETGASYVEAQYHGGITIDMIESIHISHDAGYEDFEYAVKEKLRELGIKTYRIEKGKISKDTPFSDNRAEIEAKKAKIIEL